MEESKKNCPFCGAEVNENAKKCRFCGNWFDEEIECPYCAEKIKASAKKCRFCGEWIDKKNKDNNKFKIEMINLSLKNLCENKKLIISMIAGALAGLLILLLIFAFIYVPPCKSKVIASKLEEYMSAKFQTISNIKVLNSNAGTVKKNNKGYSCSSSVLIDDVPSRIEYKYTKIGLNDFNFDAKIVLPDCFDNQIKNILTELIKKNDYLDIKSLTSYVITEYETIDKYDEKGPSYRCHAQAILTSKPGKAYLINDWDYDSATRKMKCKVDYKTYFCDNGFTACVSTNDIYDCENIED